MANASGARNMSWLQRQAQPGLAAQASRVGAGPRSPTSNRCWRPPSWILRPSRPPDYQVENRALVALGQALANSPRTILQTLTDTIARGSGLESAGLSLVTDDGQRFTGRQSRASGSRTSAAARRETSVRAGTCSTATRRCCSGTSNVDTRISLRSKSVCWCRFTSGAGRSARSGPVTQTQTAHRFDREDLRILQSLGSFASAAYQVTESIEALES